jgi:transketolase
MIVPDAKLREDLFEATEQTPTRNGFGEGLVQAAEKDERVVALSADLTESTRMEAFAQKYPKRFVQVGVAEQNLAALASGFAAYGKIPFITSYAVFSPGRNNEQIRTTIALNNVPVKIVGSHAGISVGPDGATHQALEDMALMRLVPRMTVLSPSDAEEARKATLAAAAHDGPVYIRLAREKTPCMTTRETSFEIGKANVLWRGENPQVALFATGPLVYQALVAARALAEKGIGASVTNVHTVKPIDKETILAEANKTRAVVSVEEHQIAGGLGSVLAELFAAELPTPQEFIGVHDQFGQSGTPDELLAHYKLDAASIVAAAERVISRK